MTCLLRHVYAGYLLPGTADLALRAALRTGWQCGLVWLVVLNIAGWEGERRSVQLLNLQLRLEGKCVRIGVLQREETMWACLFFLCVSMCLMDGWVAVRFCTNIHQLQRMNPNDFSLIDASSSQPSLTLWAPCSNPAISIWLKALLWLSTASQSCKHGWRLLFNIFLVKRRFGVHTHTLSYILPRMGRVAGFGCVPFFKKLTYWFQKRSYEVE